MDHFFTMKGHQTRYFLFWRINPTNKDYSILAESCETINAFYGFKTSWENSRRVLKGFIVLKGPSTCESGRTLHRYFPNFLIRCVKADFHFNFEDSPPDVEMVGLHPFDDLRKELFKEAHLSHFWDDKLVVETSLTPIKKKLKLTT